MHLILSIIVPFVLTALRFSLTNGQSFSELDPRAFEARVKSAETILFGRFNWTKSSVEIWKENLFEFSVYCTIKKSRPPMNVARLLTMVIDDDRIRNDMQKNRWFVVFPRPTHRTDLWLIDNRSSVFDLYDDLQLHLFEQFCFLNPKLPIDFPSSGLLNRCPKPSAEHCLKNGTRIVRDELLELKTFLTSTKKVPPARKKKRFIEPVW